MRRIVVSGIFLMLVTPMVLVEGSCALVAPGPGKLAVALPQAPSSPVVTTCEDTYVNVLTDKEGNLSMFAQQPLITVAADGIMAKKKAECWGWDLEGAAVMYGCLAAHELADHIVEPQQRRPVRPYRSC